VLIVGTTEGAGSLAVTVVAPALPEDEAHLRELGVSELLPRDDDLAAATRERHPDGCDSPRTAAASPRPPEPPAKAPRTDDATRCARNATAVP
jgi:hypothetical protein